VSSKRRDSSPVRVHPDGRVVYWTGGKPGLGKRIHERLGSLQAANERAQELLDRFERTGTGRAPRAGATLDEMAQAALDHLQSSGAPEGTTRQYKSSWNTWIPSDIGSVACRTANLADWTAIFNGLDKAQASESTVRSVARALNALTAYGVANGYFGTAEPFGPPSQRQAVEKRSKSQAAKRKSEQDGHITPELCPTTADVEKFAAAAEEQYPGYGSRLVLLAFGSGLRLTELLGLRVGDINLETGVINVDRQLDRHQAWPATSAPKGGKQRTALLWACYLDVARSLVADAESRQGDEHGWLFPRHRSRTRWADQAGHLMGAAAEACGWNWTFHWLRHAWASLSLAPVSSGGDGLPLVSVSRWLGHAQPSTTQDFYVQPPKDDPVIAQQATARRPG